MAQAVPEGRVFALDSQTLISIVIQLFNGVILAVALGFILYNPVKEFMDKRTKSIQSKIDDANITMAKAKKLIYEYEEKLKNIDKERIEILEAARLQAIEESKKIIEQAYKEAHEIKKRSLESINEDKRHLKEEARLYIIEVASIMAEKYITEKVDDKVQDRLYEEALAQLEEAQWLN